MVFTKAKGPFQCRVFNFPKLKPGEVLVRIDYATICTSDLHTYCGRRSGPSPCILGHEIIGRIAGLGSSEMVDYSGNPLNEGDRVTWTIYAHDHEGEMARKGFPQKSDDLFKYGHRSIEDHHPLTGGFATHCHLRAGTDIFRLPDDLANTEAAPLNCTHATVAGALRLAGDLRGARILVSGGGMLGLSACAMAREAGAQQVWLTDPNPNRIEQARSFSVDQGWLSTDPDRLAEIREAGGVDILIETSGQVEAMAFGLSTLNIGARTVWIGAVYTQPDIPLQAEQVVRNLWTISGLHNYIPEDLRTAIDFLRKHHRTYPFGELIGRTFPLDQLDVAFAVANFGPYYRVGVQPERITNVASFGL